MSKVCYRTILWAFLSTPFIAEECLLVVVEFEDSGFSDDRLRLGRAFAGFVYGDEDLLFNLVVVDVDEVAEVGA